MNEIINKIPQDKEKIYELLKDYSEEELLELSNLCVEDLIVFKGSLHDLDALRNHGLPEHNVNIIETIDRIESERKAVNKDENFGQGRGL